MKKTIKVKVREEVQKIKDEMDEKMSDTYLDENELEKEYSNGVKIHKEKFRDVPADFASEYENEWKTQLSKEWEEIKKRNKKNEEVRIKIKRTSSPARSPPSSSNTDVLDHFIVRSFVAAAAHAPINPAAAVAYTAIGVGVAAVKGVFSLF
uniref:uncharacterized protein LOC120341868 n=1 Tax=Styela clava TaxID=7725 RepID=UPI00193A83D7|nr:uncharacterized protein LOC120341868 [Styela clava]